MTIPVVTELMPNGSRIGERIELGRYTGPTGAKRIIYGQRVNGLVRVVDVPDCGRGRSYLIERELEQDGYAALNALVADYLEQARAHAQIPMEENVLDRYLRHLEGAIDLT